MAPLAISAVLLLPTAWLMPIVAALFLTGLWEWLKLSGVDGLPRSILLLLNLLLMVLLVWASAGSKVLFHLASLAGVGFWLLALLWLRFFNFGAHEESGARMFKLATGKDGMGHGDFKLLAALGAWTGLAGVLPTILISSLVGAVIGSIWLAMKGKDNATPIPFGPYLAIAGWISFFWGKDLMGAYLRFAGLA